MASVFARVLCVAAAFACAGPVVAAEEAAARSAEIPFANHGGIRDWKADGTRGLWVQDRSTRWYYATLMGPCRGLDFANTIAFETGPSGVLDAHGAIRVRNGSMPLLYCPFKTLQPSDGPPKKKPTPAQQPKEPAK